MTLLIKNVQLIDGIHDFPDTPSDVFITGDTISAIGKFPNKKADEVLNGQGAYLSPGFIDVNTDSDHYFTLFNYPSQADFLKQGVTTIFGGMCGSSLAPLLYGGLESIRKWADTTKVNISWHTVDEFLKTIDQRPLAVNFGTLVGHSTIRRALVGESIRDLTKNEKEVFVQVLKTALSEGAFGLSTGLGYVHTRKTPESEIMALVQPVQQAGGVYATHLRKVGLEVHESMAETIRLAKGTGVKILVSHFMPHEDSIRDYEAALAMIDALPADTDFHFDMYPSLSSMLTLYTFLPEWAQTGGVDIMLANLKDEWFMTRIRKDIAVVDEDAFIVAQAPGNDILVGKSLREIHDMYEAKNSQDALLKLMIATNLQAVIAYRNLDESHMRSALSHPRALIGSNSPSFDEAIAPFRLKNERTSETFTKFLSLVESENLMPLKDAVRKLAYEPAKKFGLKGYGDIHEGGRADFACFKNSEIKFTIVNGKIAVKNGEFQNIFAGKAFRHTK